MSAILEIKVDTHTHTTASVHAYSTLNELVTEAVELGLSGIALTNHGPSLPDAPMEWHFSCLRFLPPIIRGIRVLSGVEANILDTSGRLDLDDKLLKTLELVIASFHEPCFEPMGVSEHTEAWLGVIKNPYVDVLGHMGSGNFPFDMPAVLKEAAAHGKIVEINNRSFMARSGAKERCREIALLCKKYGVFVVASSDAHSMYELGRVPNSLRLLREIEMPEELVLNTSLEKLLKFLSSKKKLRGQD